MRPDAKPMPNGIWAYLSGWAREANPHAKGTFEFDLWNDDWDFQAEVDAAKKGRVA